MTECSVFIASFCDPEDWTDAYATFRGSPDRRCPPTGWRLCEEHGPARIRASVAIERAVPSLVVGAAFDIHLVARLAKHRPHSGGGEPRVGGDNKGADARDDGARGRGKAEASGVEDLALSEGPDGRCGRVRVSS